MGVNSLPKTVIRQRRGCDLNPGPSAPESSTLTTRLPRHHSATSFNDVIDLLCFERRYADALISVIPFAVLNVVCSVLSGHDDDIGHSEDSW